jgi:FMN phosphatase YigB (HAD superfamily)
MKLLLENWRKYLKETDNLEQNVYSFDFDNTLIRYHTLEDGDVEYTGDHEENIQLVKDLAADGNKVIIVTSRFEPKERDLETGYPVKHPEDKAPSPDELIATRGLPIDEIWYTSGEHKAKMLADLGVTHHWDDDEEEVAAAEAAGIGATFVDPTEEGITGRLRDKWFNLMAKSEEETN